jgi:DNA-binding CsgD family transcriptional regulator
MRENLVVPPLWTDPATTVGIREKPTADERIDRFVDWFCYRSSLSPRQTELVRHAVTGIHRKESASRLGCRLKTIEKYWQIIYVKTGCESEAEVVAKFILEVVGVAPSS